MGCASKEKDPACRQIIREHAGWCRKATGFFQHTMPCIHPDQLDIFPDGTFDWRGERFLRRAQVIDKSCIKERAICMTHPLEEGGCSLWNHAIDICTAGLPCTDQSAVGAGRCEEGPSSNVFLSHAKYNVERRTKVLIIENVSDRCGRACHLKANGLAKMPDGWNELEKTLGKGWPWIERAIEYLNA